MNGIIIIDKPSGWTSHDVVGKLRRILGERRIGHGGTLDPLATGVLPVFIGRATRAVEFCESADKDYTAGIRLGIVTDTQDITGNILEVNKYNCDENLLRDTLASFLGEQEQIPPMYSAVKINGKKLYELARKGIETERKPRKITISKIEMDRKDGTDYFINITCSKGTYVRTICHDIGQRIGCGAVMSSLRRTRAGVFSINDALTLHEVEETAARGEAESFLRPVDNLFLGYPSVKIDSFQEKKCRNGADFKVKADFTGYCRVYSENDSFLMLGNIVSGEMKTVKSFFEINSGR